MLDELLPLAAERAGGLAWEYYFSFGGGRPPWVSGLAQGTAVQALARAAARLKRQADVLPIAQRALAIFDAPTPQGVRVPGRARQPLRDLLVRARPAGAQRLHPVAGRPARLRAAVGRPARDGAVRGGRAARRATRFRCTTPARGRCTRAAARRASPTSAITICSQGFLEGLCRRTDGEVYCTTAENFVAYKSQPPAVAVQAAPPARRQGRPRGLRALEDLERVAAHHARDEARGDAAVRRGRLRQADLRLGRPAPARRLHGPARRPRSRRQCGLGPGRGDGAEGRSASSDRRIPGLVPSDHPLHRQGRGREDLRGRRHRPPQRRGRRAHARPLDRPRALARRVAPARGGRRADRGRRRRVGAAGAGAGGARAELVRRAGLARRRAGRARRRADRRRGADRPARGRRAVLAAAAQAPRGVRRVGRDRRRLRADRRDAASALVPGCRALVAGPRARPRERAAGGRAPDRARVPGPLAAGRARDGGHPAARPQPDRHARAAARRLARDDPARRPRPTAWSWPRRCAPSRI